mgnify:CR=1 FL=1
MIAFILDAIEPLFSSYGTISVFLAGFLEEVIFFIPSSAVFLSSGFFMISPELTFWPALLQAFLKIGILTAAGVSLGSFLVYGLV